MAAPRDVVRLRQRLNPLTTSALGAHGAQQHGTPISAISMASPHSQSLHTPASAIQPYNPQQWLPPGAPPMPDRQVQYGAEAQAAAPPPPPYSPPRSRQQRPVSTAFEHAVAPISTPSPRMASTLAVHVSSPDPPANPLFPPPPGLGGRGNSRDRRFGLPSLGRRREPEQQASPPETHRVANARMSMGPITVYAPEPQRLVAGPFRDSMPPAARRAASTGAIDTPTSQRSRSTSQSRWEPGMPLPPPPPGPPPSASRSQSVQSVDRDAVPIISPPTRRPPPSGVTSLGPVPPTPADWVDTDAQPIPAQSEKRRSLGLAIDTDAARTSDRVTEALGSASSTGSLSRAGAVRHDKTILQRRTERHTSHGSIDAVANPQAISDIVVPSAANALNRRLTITKSTPRSAGRPSEPPRSGDSMGLHDSRNSTPRGLGSAQLPGFETATPPFSPHQNKPGSSSGLASVPKALPTSPLHKRSGSGSQPRDSSRPPPSEGTTASKHAITSQTADQFAASTVERFQAFAAQESTAASDADRVRLFADFIVNESRIRRERYASAISAMGSEIFDLTRDLFRPMTNSRRESATSQEGWTPSSAGPSRSHLDSSGLSSASDGISNSAPASANFAHSPTAANSANANYGGTNYMPSLSPILSMSVSDNHENGSSRGRPPSRWWETDSGGDPARGWERSKRESKYMGVSRDQWVDDGPDHTGAGEGSSSAYPPEKTGWHDRDESSWTPQQQMFSNISMESSSSPATKTEGLDMSRLITMPPPYPRHHPAVNNNHPELTGTRTAVRGLTELAEIDDTKERFALASSKRRDEHAKATAERRKALRENLQKEIGAGNIGYADAAAIESDFETQERDKIKELEKAEYEQFQNVVIVPLNEQLSVRIAKATDLFDNLARQLFTSGENDADMPQEEGDDRPELLEKLTLLKWIFETREFLHRTIYDLLTDRNARYRDVVLTPYRLSGNTEKLQSAEDFFATDASNRNNAYANEVLNRAREFRTVVDEAVQRGVALQLSAFWDIAPPLRGLVDSIPSNLRGFSIQIPPSEFEENPAYHHHPLQYLFSLLLHAERSTYQFIESHTNLLCLLHEVKEAVANGKGRVVETQLQEADGTPIAAETRMARAQQMRQDEERRLTDDLKEKVRVVQEQWNSALGDDLKSVKERTRAWLLETGGWDETLEEGGFVVLEE